MLILVPIELRDANAFVERYHRHHGRVVQHRWSLGVRDDVKLELHGVAIVGRPRARMSDDGYTVEVLRLCTDGTPNACSFLYAAAARCARAHGFRRLITYTLSSEAGTSLRAAGWLCKGETGGGSWSRQSRPRTDPSPIDRKVLWEAP